MMWLIQELVILASVKSTIAVGPVRGDNHSITKGPDTFLEKCQKEINPVGEVPGRIKSCSVVEIGGSSVARIFHLMLFRDLATKR